mmetsp:Transcript_102855/g.268513  ORF Transcript_102855/g.268513 Transcript_102855/m.268513 type:complete len:345 (+) Transcript_102855:211-1245(+)
MSKGRPHLLPEKTGACALRQAVQPDVHLEQLRGLLVDGTVETVRPALEVGGIVRRRGASVHQLDTGGSTPEHGVEEADREVPLLRQADEGEVALEAANRLGHLRVEGLRLVLAHVLAAARQHLDGAPGHGQGVLANGRGGLQILRPVVLVIIEGRDHALLWLAEHDRPVSQPLLVRHEREPVMASDRAALEGSWARAADLFEVPWRGQHVPEVVSGQVLVEEALRAADEARAQGGVVQEHGGESRARFRHVHPVYGLQALGPAHGARPSANGGPPRAGRRPGRAGRARQADLQQVRARQLGVLAGLLRRQALRQGGPAQAPEREGQQQGGPHRSGSPEGAALGA